MYGGRTCCTCTYRSVSVKLCGPCSSMYAKIASRIAFLLSSCLALINFLLNFTPSSSSPRTCQPLARSTLRVLLTKTVLTVSSLAMVRGGIPAKWRKSTRPSFSYCLRWRLVRRTFANATRFYSQILKLASSSMLSQRRRIC